MHRPVWIRILTLLWGVWFTTALTEPAGILACAMHGGVPAQAPATPAVQHHGALATQHATPHALDAQASHVEHAAHASHAGRPAHAEVAEAADPGAAGDASRATAATSPSHEAPPHGCCTCLGQCCTAAPVTTPAVVFVAIAREVQVDAAAPVVGRVELPARRDHTLPFANGPPIVA